jgi:hypothetical protein
MPSVRVPTVYDLEPLLFFSAMPPRQVRPEFLVANSRFCLFFSPQGPWSRPPTARPLLSHILDVILVLVRLQARHGKSTGFIIGASHAHRISTQTDAPRRPASPATAPWCGQSFNTACHAPFDFAPRQRRRELCTSSPSLAPQSGLCRSAFELLVRGMDFFQKAASKTRLWDPCCSANLLKGPCVLLRSSYSCRGRSYCRLSGAKIGCAHRHPAMAESKPPTSARARAFFAI